MVQQKYTTQVFAVFFSNRFELQSEILPTYFVILYTHYSLISI